MRQPCSVDGCDTPRKAFGYCDKHYQRVKRHGDPFAGATYGKRGPECSVRNCSAPVVARGWCTKHYTRWQTHGDPLVYKALSRNNEPCSVEGCETPYLARGLCGKHYARWQTHGDPTFVRKRGSGKWRVARDGYVYRHMPDHPNASKSGRISQHIVVMSELLGRALLPGECVHHKNGVRSDNRPENLELWSRCHPPGQRVSELIAFAHEILERYKDDLQLWPEGLLPP